MLELLGVVLAIGIAAWEYVRAERAEKRLNAIVTGLPSQLAEVVMKQLSTSADEGVAQEGGSHDRFLVSHADVDGDGADELLVQYAVGAHGSALDAFGFRDLEFTHLGGLNVGTPEGFKIADYDGDGRFEIGARETDWSVDLPYYIAPRMTIWYRWNGQEFVPIAEDRDYTAQDLADRRAQFQKDMSPDLGAA